MDWKVVPIDQWPGEPTEERKSHPFRVTTSKGWTRPGVDWTSTVELLERELRMLDAENVLLQMAVTRNQIRNDGWIRADASPEHPGVILTFDSKHGPLSYPTDTFDDWQANIRAIALALEALRKVDRYGVTRTGQQYQGWNRLPGAGQTTTTMTVMAAAVEMAKMTEIDAEELLDDPEAVKTAYRTKVKWAHPDQGGDEQAWLRIQDALKTLTRHHGQPA